MKLRRQVQRDKLLLIVIGIFILILLFLSSSKTFLPKLFMQDKSTESVRKTDQRPTPTFAAKETTATPTLLPYKEAVVHPTKNADVENGYVLIPEIGIKFKVIDNISDFIYEVETFDDPKYQNYKTANVRFSTQTLFNMDNGCSPQYGAIGDISRSLNNPLGEGSNIKKIGDYYYSFLSPQASCSVTKSDNNIGSVEGKQIQNLQAAFQTIQPIE